MSIASEISRLQNDSSAIASAISAKGVTVPAGSGFDDYASLISQISGGGYELAEYIQTTKNAYLNTGIVQRSRNFELTIKFQWMGSDPYESFETFVGYMASGGTTPRSGVHKYNTSGMIIFGTNATATATGFGVLDNYVHTVLISGNASNNKETISIDGVLQNGSATTSSTGIGANTIPFFLGARNRNGSVDNLSNARFYSLNYKYFNDSAHTTIVEEYNLIPIKRNGVFQMLDTINKTFHPSISGTDFTGQL